LFFIAKIVLLVGLIKLLVETNSPLLCAGVYIAVRLFFGLLLGYSIGALFISSIFAGAMAALYFWLLDRFEGAGLIFWVIAIGGLIIGLV
jgi:hypothetical protein